MLSHNPNKLILVVDDDSPDKTAEIMSERQTKDPNLYILRRKYKLGLGSAQKAIIVYSIVHNYKKVPKNNFF